jgi:peptide/nickel transport system substrate-binding protein
MTRTRAQATLALAALAGGTLLLAVAAFARPAPAGTARVIRGGTIRIDGFTGRLDPALGYFWDSWQTFNATHLYLLGYPDREGPDSFRLTPRAAALPTISADGRTYTFRIRRGFRFSDGRPVTAANFAHAINRVLSPVMQSPGATFVEDVVGAKAVQEGRAKTASGVVARGRVLRIRLRAAAPDFVHRISMTFFPALPLDLPTLAGGVTEAPLHSAGPYYVKERIPGPTGRTVAVRNPYWSRRLSPDRPANVDRIEWTGAKLDTARRIERDEADLVSRGGTNGAGDSKVLAAKYGINRGRLFRRQSTTLWYLAFNQQRPLFRDNAPLRRAVNYALDRAEIARAWGALDVRRTDQILPFGFPGFRDYRLYPLAGANVRKARQLARGRLRGGKATLWTVDEEQVHVRTAEIVKYNLEQIGLDVEVRILPFNLGMQRIGQRGEGYDLALVGWAADYPDPANFLGVLLDARDTGTDAPGHNVGFFDVPAYNSRIAAAERLFGRRRLAAYARLDHDLMRDQAPVAPLFVETYNILVSPSFGCFNLVMRAFVSLVSACKKP